MGKVITVWGSPGSGKSMFCCILAKALTRDKRKAIIINADMNVPMLPVWLPEQIIQTNTSIGQVLSSVEIDTSLVASHVTVLKNYPFIGMMGYAAGENPLSYPEVKYTMVLQLIHAAAKLVVPVAHRVQDRFSDNALIESRNVKHEKAFLIVLLIVPQIDKLPHAVIASEEANLRKKFQLFSLITFISRKSTYFTIVVKKFPYRSLLCYPRTTFGTT